MGTHLKDVKHNQKSGIDDALALNLLTPKQNRTGRRSKSAPSGWFWPDEKCTARCLRESIMRQCIVPGAFGTQCGLVKGEASDRHVKDSSHHIGAQGMLKSRSLH